LREVPERRSGSGIGELGSRVRASVSWTAIASGVALLLQAVQMFAAARLLEPVDIGVFALCAVLLFLVDAVADFGLAAYVVHRQDLDDIQLAALQTANLVLGCVLGTGLFLAAPLVGRMFDSEALGSLLGLCAVSYFLSPFGGRTEWQLRRDLRFNVISRVQITSGGAGLLVFLSLALAGVGAMSLAAGHLARSGLAACQFAWIGRGAIPFANPRAFPWRSSIAHFGLPQIGERLVNVASERLDQIVIGRVAGLEALGLYSFALSLLSLPVVRVNGVATVVALPVLARLRHNQSAVAAAYVRMLRALTSINAPYIVGLAVLASAIVPVVFGEEWRSAVPLIHVLAVLGLLRAIGNPVGCLLLAAGAARRGFLWNLAVLGLSIVTVWAGASLWGILGVAVLMGAKALALAPLAYVCLVRPVTGPIGRLYSSAAGLPVMAAALAGLVAWSLGWLNLPAAVMVSVQISAFAVIYVATLATLEPGLRHEVTWLLGARRSP
jgi:lipopolysaccharide exporter